MTIELGDNLTGLLLFGPICFTFCALILIAAWRRK